MSRFALILTLALASPLAAQEDPIMKLYQSARTDLAARKFADAEAKLLEAYEKAVDRAGADHPNSALVHYELGEVYLTRAEKGDYDRAAKIYRSVIAVREKALGENHASTINAVDRLGEVHSLQRKYEEAEPLLLRSLKARVKPSRPRTA